MALRAAVPLLLSAAAVGAQSDWAWRHPQPQGHPLYGVAWAGTRFVAVGDYGTVVDSEDGGEWRAAWTGSRNRLYGVAWRGLAAGPEPGLLVAVGDSGTLLTSPDGGTWTQRRSGTALGLFGVAHGHGRFVAVGDAGTVLTSTDGMTWTRRESGTDLPLLAVAWAENQFVAVCGGVILTSPDGAAWTFRDPGARAPLRGVGWGGGRIVVVGDDAVILTSEDGAAWTLRNLGIVQLRGVVWTGDGFLAAGKYGWVRASRDGIAWDSAYVGNDEDYFAVAWSPAGRAAIVGNAGSIAATDQAGRWSARSAGVRKTLRAVAGDGRGRYLAVGDDGAVLRGDGAAFAPESLGTLNGFRTVVWAGPGEGEAGPGRWVAAGWLGVFRSDDGARWEAVGGAAYDPRFDVHSLLWMEASGAAGGTLVAVGQGGVIQTSPDGSRWTLRDSGRAAELRSVAWSGSRLVAVGMGPILVSGDAIAWSQAHPGPGHALNHVAAGAGLFVAVGAGGSLLTSPDGQNWTARVSGTDKELHCATWTGQQWIVIGESGLVLRSPDGVDWRPEGYMGGYTLYAVIRTPQAIGLEGHGLLAVGADGTILSAREDLPTVIRPGFRAILFLATQPEGLRFRLPEALLGRPVTLSIFDMGGTRRLQVHGTYPREAVVPLAGMPGGRYVLDIRGGGRRLAQSFRVLR